MRSQPACLPAADVAAAVARDWGLRVGNLRYVALGGGSYHWTAVTPEARKYFLTVDDLRAKPWLGADPDAVFGGLRAAFDTAAMLHDTARLAFVVGPLRSQDGRSVCRLTPRYSLAVFPFVAGQPGRWGELPQRDRVDLVELLSELHQAMSAAAPGAPGRGVEFYERNVLEQALGDLEQPWTSGPFAERSRRELASRAAAVTAWLAEFDDLAAGLRIRGPDLVVTHGEPHPGNLIRADGRLMLVDWDTVALAPPERDLWMLDDGRAGPAQPRALARYTELTGRAVDSAAIRFYRLAWKLADIAAFTRVLRSAHRRDRDTEHAWWALQVALSADPPQPAGR